MFGLFRSKKEKAAAKKLEKADSFYQTNSLDEDDDLQMGRPSEMNDVEYRRRVTEEIAKRKSPGKPVPVVAKSSPISKPITPGKSPVTNFSPVGRAPAPVSAVSTKSATATPTRSPAAVPTKQTTPSSSAKPSAVSTPGSRPGTVPSTPAAVAAVVSASRPNSATTAPLTRASNIAASKPSSAGSTPNATTTKSGFFSADAKAVQQLVSMGFSYPASTLALMKNDNKIDLATEFLLERSDEEMNHLLALESAAMANASKKTTPAASPAPSPAASPLKRAVSTNKAAAARALFIQTQNLNSRSGPPSMESPQPSKSPPVVARAPSQRVAKGKDAAVDSAMAAIIAKREALKKADGERSSKNASPAVQDSPAAVVVSTPAAVAAETPSPSKPSPFERMSSYKTKGQILREEKDEENRRLVEAQEARRKALREMSLASSPGAAGTTTTPGGTPVLENRAFEALHMKKTHSMVLAEEAEQAKKAEVEAQEKRRKSLTQSDSSPGPPAAKQTADRSGDSCGDSVVTTNTSNTAFDSLYSKKTRAMLVAEAVEKMQREQQEAHEAEIHAQAMRRKLLRDASPGGTRGRTSSVDSVSVITTSTLNKSGAFENLHLTKTRSMLMAEAADESVRVEKEAQERKWKKATTPRSAISEGYLTTENEVFDKLHSKKRVNQEIREQVTFEEKAHLEKREAHMLGKAGANLPALDDSKLLHRTKSAFMREQLKEEERQRAEEARATHAAKRMDSFSRAASIKSFRSPSSEGDANHRNLTSVSDDTLTESDSSVNRSIRRGKSNSQLVPSTSNMLDGIGATIVDDFSDIEEEDEEDEDDDRMPTLDVNERAPVKRTAPTQAITHKNSDFFKFGQSFYANDSKSSFRAKQSFRRSEGGLLSSNNSSRNLLEMKVEEIRGHVRRTSMHYEVYETSDHMWAGKVTLPANPLTSTIETLVTLRGTYATREQCVSITAANAPPVRVEAQKNSTCRVCEEAFNKYLKAEHCNNCGQLVCMDCSDESWPATMFPYTFVERKTKPRACSACTHLMEKFVAALKAGDLDQAKTLVETGNVNLYFPFSVYPDAPYPVSLLVGFNIL